MKTKIKKIQKPIDVDVHFKYRCPEPKCGYEHWLSLKESQTKNFKIVCDCGYVYKPKRISTIKIVYEDIQQTPKIEKPTEANKVIEKPKIPVDFKNSCVKLLVSYGFTKDESISLCEKAFEKNPVTSSGLLIKYVLQNLEELNVNN
jgi:hypothetical protein